jgi:hypothetical protein
MKKGSAMAHYYFDANALIKYSTLQDYKSKLGIAETGVNEIRQLMLQPNNTIFYSSLTLLEAWNVLFKSYRKGLFGSRKSRANKALQIIIETLIADLQSPPFEKLDTEMNEKIVTQAQWLVERYGLTKDVGLLDMLHIAFIKCSRVDSLIMVSSDNGVKNVCTSEIISLFDPEKPII